MSRIFIFGVIVLVKKTDYNLRLFIFSIVLILCFLVLLIVSYLSGLMSKQASSEKINYTVVIDPGHGGIDTGASGISGAYESVLCLDLSKKLSNLFSVGELCSVMTRTEDVSVQSKHTELSRKRADLSGRVEFCESIENPIFVSIHMNNYPLESCFGAEIYYSGNNEDSVRLADMIKSRIDKFQPTNKRPNKLAKSNIYVLDKLNCPAILIECGFLSNPDENALLNTEEYREKLAFIIYQGICEFTESKNTEDVWQKAIEERYTFAANVEMKRSNGSENALPAALGTVCLNRKSKKKSRLTVNLRA